MAKINGTPGVLTVTMKDGSKKDVPCVNYGTLSINETSGYTYPVSLTSEGKAVYHFRQRAQAIKFVTLANGMDWSTDVVTGLPVDYEKIVNAIKTVVPVQP